MASHSHRSMRVVPGTAHEHSPSPAPSSRATANAFAALLKRARHARERTAAATDSALLDDDSIAFAAYQSALSSLHANRERDSRRGSPDTTADEDPDGDFDVEQRSLLAHLPRLASTLGIADVMDTAYGGLADRLASRIAQFCGEPSVQSSGAWEASIPLARDTVADTVLHLSLSPYQLRLRFDTSNPQSKQLISLHCNTLRDRLVALLGPERDIDIT